MAAIFHPIMREPSLLEPIDRQSLCQARFQSRRPVASLRVINSRAGGRFMLKTMLSALALLVVSSTSAQTPPLPATDVSNSDIQAFINALPRDAVSDRAIRVVDVGGYR